MAKKTKEQLKAELNGWGRAYNAAKRRGDKVAMAEAHAKADAIRKEAGWNYNEKTGVTTQKSSSGKSTTITSATNIENAKVKDPKKLKTFAEEKKAVAQKQAAKSLPALGGLMDKSTQAAVNNLTAGSKKNVSGTLALGNGPVKNALPVAQSAQKSSGSKWTADNIAKGFGYGAERTLSGAVGAVEDTLRFVSGYGNKLLSGITSLGGLADNPVSDFLAKTAEDTLANSLTDQWKQDIQDRYQPDKTAQFIGSLGEAAGAMIPTIAAGLATGGMSAGTAIGKGAAMTAQAAQAAERTANGIALASMLPSVMESSTRRAMQEGADINEALIYGALSGALETGTESLFAGIPGMKSGTVSDIIKRITQNPVAERALDIAGEGAEEVISGAADPYLQRMTYNENAKNASAGELAGQFATGALLSGVMQGASGVAARVADIGLGKHGALQTQTQNTVQGQDTVDLPAPYVPLEVESYTPQVQSPLPQTQSPATVEQILKMVTGESQSTVTPTQSKTPKMFDGNWFAETPTTASILGRLTGTGTQTDANGALVQGSWADGGIKPKLGSDVDVRPQNTLRASRPAVSASDVGRYIQSAMEGQVTGSLYTGKLSGNAARDVYAATGIDADGYAVKLTEQAIGDTMHKINMGSEMTMSDLSHIGEMALSAEQAERGGTVLRKDALGTQDLKQSRGAQGASLPTVRLIKNGENGGYVITMAIDRANRSGYILSLDTVAEAAQVAQTQTIMPVSTPQAAQTVQDTAQTVVGENTQVQAGIAQNASDGSFRVGETVRALDRGNIGTVVQYYPESGLYDVNFRDSQTGSNETITLSADMLEGMWTGERLKNPQTQAELTLMRNNQLDGLNSDSYDLTGVTEQEAWQWAERVHAKHEAQRAGQAANRATPSTVDAPMMEGGIVDRIVKVANDCEIERLALMRLRQEMQLTEADLVDAREYAAGRKMTRPGKITTEKAGEIMRYGEALKAYNMRMREVRDLQTQIKEQRRVTAEELIAASDKWHDTKHGKLLDIRTPERVIRYIMGDTPEAQAIIDAYFTPVHRHEAESIHWQNEQRNKLREITKGSTREESVYVHMYNRLQENPGDSALQKQAGDYLEAHKKKINMDRVRKMHDQMVELTRSFYDDINEAGLRNGEEALEFRQNYIPSLQAIEEGGWINRLLRGMGIETMADELPTSIAGKTEEFRPVRKWQQFRQQRRGTDTEFDAVKAMDQYITNAAHAIYHTDDIHNLRTLEEAIRYKHSTEGGQAELDAIRQNPELSIDERTAKREEVWERSTTAFPSFPTWLAQYTNNLAGKKSAADRKTEHGFGRGFYRAVSDIETKVASNMVGFNVSTAFTNFIPLAQGKGELRGTSMMRAMKEFLGEKMQGRTDYRDASTFLTNRQGADKVAKTAGDKLMDASGVLMGTVDEFTSNVLHRARVMDNVEVHNMRYEDAMAEADSWTAGLMGDRSLGAMPNIFNEKNFFTKAFTMFQLEVANQYGYLFEDLPHNAKARTTSKTKAVGYVAGALTQILAASLLYNDLAEEVTGRRPALDPVGIVNDFVGQLTGYSIPNSVDLVRSAMDGGISKDDFKVQKGSVEDAVTEAALATANQIPGLSMLAEGGRLPVTAAIPSPAKLGSGVMAGIRAIGGNPAEGDKKALSDAGSELSKLLTYLVMPTGGSQLKKTVTGARDVQAGGRYGLDFEGNRVLNYPLYTDDGNTARTLQALLFGSTATKPGREWIESEFTSGLDAEQTKTYDKVRQTGADQRTVYNLLHDLAGMSDAFDKRDYLSEFDNLNKDQKQAIDRGVIAGEGKPADYTDYDSMILSSEYNDDSKTSQAVRRLKDTYGIPVSISHRLIKNIQNMDNVNQTDDQNLLTSINQAQYLDNSQKDALALELIVNATKSRAKGWAEDVKGKMDVREYAGYALKLAEVKQRYTGQDDADKKADADMWAYLKKEDLSEDARLALCDALSIDIVPENYSMLTNKNQIKQMGALEQSELPFDTYMRVWEMKKATNEDGTYKYKKDQVVNEMERMGLSKAQINAVCQSFGWAAPYKQTSSKKNIIR
ncbi:hypothetical protein [Butyricicoccus pullicaecorum]|uniref:hypothetical protein n=1 Tax=Butyricicoccus pullicaecorum TaxID=501571 RepID=UPI0035227DAD